VVALAPICADRFRAQGDAPARSPNSPKQLVGARQRGREERHALMPGSRRPTPMSRVPVRDVGDAAGSQDLTTLFAVPVHRGGQTPLPMREAVWSDRGSPFNARRHGDENGIGKWRRTIWTAKRGSVPLSSRPSSGSSRQRLRPGSPPVCAAHGPREASVLSGWPVPSTGSL